jgi:hypothetical protein
LCFEGWGTLRRTGAQILINGTNVEIFIRGEGSAAKLNLYLGPSARLANQENITGMVREINIVVPSSPASSSTSSGTQGNSTPQAPYLKTTTNQNP